jgi:hypothetical protein
MENILKSLQKDSFSGRDILRILDGKTKIISYDMLSDMKNIDDLFGEFNSVCILYKTQPNYGHWTCVLRHRNSVEFFDPYGYFIDDQFNYIPEEHKLPKYLSNLILNSGLNVEYNDEKLQGDTTATCARHCCMRIAMKNIPIDNYCAMMKNFRGMKPDEIVAMMTAAM